MANHTLGEKFRALLATGRVANLPTVWSNVIMAFYLALTLSPMDGFQQNHSFTLWLVFFASIATSCLYVGGCMLGDYRDISFDRDNRPNRPLVTGLLSPTSVAITATTLLTLGLLIGGLSSISAFTIAFDIPLSSILASGIDEIIILLQTNQLSLLVILVLFIITYALFHKRSRPFALANMALCRTQLIIVATALAMPIFRTEGGSEFYTTLSSFLLLWHHYPILITSAAVGIYTLLLASVAANESNKDKIKFSHALKVSMFLLPVIVIGILFLTGTTELPLYGNVISESSIPINVLRGYFIGTIIVYCGWMIHAFSSLPNDKHAFVSRALAGFCLLDACFAATYSLTVPLICLVCFGLSLLLQKIAPAT